MINEYLIGQRVRISAAFTDADGDPADPTTVVLTIKTPAGVTSTLSTTNDTAGSYHSDTTPDAVGQWWYRWVGTGTVVAAAEGTFLVTPSKVA